MTAGACTTASRGRFISSVCGTCSVAAKNCSKRLCAAPALAARGAGADRTGLRPASRVAWSSTRPRRPGHAGLGLELRTGTAGLGPVHVRTEPAPGGTPLETCDALVLVPDRSDDRRHEPLGRASPSSGRGQPQSLGRKPHLAWRSGTGDLDVGDPHLRPTRHPPIHLPDQCPLPPPTPTHPRLKW